jgi:hypothetical protein
MSKESTWRSLPRILMIIGGVMTLIFGLLSAFIPGLHYVEVVWCRAPWCSSPNYIKYFPFKLQLHDNTLGLVLCSVGGLLGLISSLRRDKRLVSTGFAGDFLAILAFVASYPPHSLAMPFYTLFPTYWVGSCLTIIGVCILFVGLMLESRGWLRLSILGVPLFLFVLLYPLLAATKNFYLFFSIYRNYPIQALFGILIYIGLGLTLLGSAIGVWKFLPNLRQTTHAS